MKTIAIIGATGSMGSAIAKSLAKSGKYRLLLMSKDQDELAELKLEVEKSGTEAFAMSCAREASWEADTIIIAAPFEARKEIVERIREVAVGKTVISLSESPSKLASDLAMPTNERVADLQKLLPHSKVVSAFDNSSAEDFVTAHDLKAVDAFIAGKDRGTVEAVSAIVRNAGFNPVIARKVIAGSTNVAQAAVSDSTEYHGHLQLFDRMGATQLNMDHMENTGYSVERFKSYIALLVLLAWVHIC